MTPISRLIGRMDEDQKGATYTEFLPPHRPEEYVGQAGPHDGKALPFDVLEAIAQAKLTGKPHGYLIRGQWVRKADKVRYLDVAVDRAWVVNNSNYQIIDGFLRWVCPGCQKLSGAHAKGCDYR